MAGGGELQITLSGEVAEELRHALPKGRSLDKSAEKIVRDWIHDRAVEREARRLDKIVNDIASGKQKTHSLQELKASLGA